MACLPPLPATTATTATPATSATSATSAMPVRPPGPCWQLRLLGDTVLMRPDGQPQRLPGAVATQLLALLALAPDRAQPRETLIELLWPGVDLVVGRNRLRQLLSALKAALGPGDELATLLQADRHALRLHAGALACDVVDFEAALGAGRRQAASALYRGELMPGHHAAWVHEERLRLAARAGMPDPPALAVPARLDPLPGGPPPGTDPAAQQLPRYLTRLHGAQAQVQLLQAEVTQHRLVTLLGPGGHGKTRLAVEVARMHQAALRWPAQAPAAGRGFGGPGSDAGTDAGFSGFDLVAFVPLVGCRDGPLARDELLAAMLLALHQAPGSQPALAHLQRQFAGRRTLLVLDNGEQVAAALAAVVADLLALCSGLHLLVTSRRALGVDGERRRTLPALPLPDPQDGAAGEPDAAANPAVALFLDRARAVAPDFDPDRLQLAAVVALVRHLQGMPLAIELAAAHLAGQSPASLLQLLQGASARPDAAALRLLARSGPRSGGDPRHASMLAVVAWSWQLLSPAARRLLPRLSLLPGSFSLEAALALAATPPVDAALALQELVAHSMLRAAPGSDRFVMYELIREFAASELPAADQAVLRQRHRRWMTAWFQRLPLSTPLQQIRPELPNLVSALAGAEADGDFLAAAQLAGAAQSALSAISLPAPTLAALQRCAAGLADPVQQALMRAGLARSLLLGGQAEAAGQLARQVLAQLPSAQVGLPATTNPDGPPEQSRPGLPRALVLTRVAHVLWRLQRDARAGPWLDEALALARRVGDTALQATILTNQGALLRATDPATSIALQRRAVALWAAAGDAHGVSVGRCNLALALLASRAGAAEALALAGQAMRDTRDQGDELQHALACNLYGEAWTRLGQWQPAARAYLACIDTAYAAAEPWPLVYGLWNLPRALAHLGQAEAAATLMGFASRHALDPAAPQSAADRHDLRRVRRLCQALAGAAAVRGWWQAGQALGLSAAVRRARLALT